MKKSNLFLVLLTALIVMSCSKDETSMSIPQEGNAIEFGTYVGRDAQTRASVFTTTELASQGFGVFAYYTGTATYAEWLANTEVTSKAPNFMNNQKVTGTPSGSEYTWTYSPIKYWPNNVDDKVSFFAYAPYSDDSQNNISDFTGNTATGDPTLKFTVNGTVKEQTDLVWGVNESTGFPFLNQTKQTVTEDIKFTFKHALARIGFNVEAMVDLVNNDATGDDDTGTDNGAIDGDTKIVVTQVQLIGKFYKSGVLNLNNTANATPIWGSYEPTTLGERTFTLSQASGNLLTPHNDASNISTAGQLVTNAKAPLNAIDSYIMVIPQDLETDKIKIIVTYDVITKDPSLAGDESKITNTITSNEFGFKFEHGKAYTFNLHLGMTSVKFDADVTGWDPAAGTEHVVNVPINTAP